MGNYGGLYGGDARGLYSSQGRHSTRGMMIYGKPPRRWPKALLAIVIALIVICCLWQFACGGLPFPKGDDAQQQAQQEQQAQQDQAQQDQDAQTEQSQSSEDADIKSQEATKGTYQKGVNATIKISAVGDCTLGTDSDFDDSTNFTSVYNSQSDSYFFRNVTAYTSNDDLTLANLEGPLTESTDIQEKTFNFKGPAKYANILVKGSVEGVNLANNHSFDYGRQGYEDTKKALAKYKITNFGYDRTAVKTVNGIKVGLFGISQLSNDQAASTMKKDIKGLRKKGCALIIGMFHWGVEGDHEASSSQVKLAHQAVDAGCDLVIGGHPHVLQGVELYKNRYICYSMGNFVFGGNSNPSDKDTMIFQQSFTFKDGWLQVDDSSTPKASVVPCSLSGKTSINNYQPMPLSKKDGAALVKRLNSYSAKLSGTAVEFSTKLDESNSAQVK